MPCVSHAHRHIFGIAEAPHTNSHGGGSLQSPAQVLSMAVRGRASHWKKSNTAMPNNSYLLNVLPVVFIAGHAVVVILRIALKRREPQVRWPVPVTGPIWKLSLSMCGLT